MVCFLIVTLYINGFLPEFSKAQDGPKVLFKGTITTAYLNVRTGASKSAKSIGVLKKGAVVSVVQTGRWMKICYKNGYDYISDKYVQKIAAQKATTRTSYVLNVPTFNQYPQLPRGCEVTSLSMLLTDAGQHIDKMTLASQITKVPYYSHGKYGNPHDGFVGNMYSFKYPGFGVYHEPIYTLAKRYLGQRIADMSGCSWSAVESQIRKGRPVWVIANTWFRYLPANQWRTWRTRSGYIHITMHEHSVVVTGYDSNFVYINDPMGGKKNRRLNKKAFISAWQQMGSQTISFN